MTNETTLGTNRELLVELLNQEIAFAQSEEQRSGWTLWALAGAGAALVFFALDAVESEQLSLLVAAKWVVVIAIPVDLIVNSLWTWSVHSGEPRRVYRFLLEFEHQQVAFGWRIAHSLGILVIALGVREGVWIPAVVVTVLWYGLLILVAMIVIPAAGAELPYLVKPLLSKRNTLLGLAVGSLLVLGSAVSYAVTLPPIQAGSSTAELRLALVSVTVSYLCFRLLLGIRHPWQLRRLVSIRRDLALGRLTLGQAAGATEVALLSAGPQQVLHEHLRTTTLFADEAREYGASALQRIADLAEDWGEVQTRWADLSKIEARAEIERLEDLLDEIGDTRSELNKWTRRVSWRLNAVSQHFDRMRRESPTAFAGGFASLTEQYRITEATRDQLAKTSAWVNDQAQGIRDQLASLKRV
jgi:hypothetical protein